MSEYQQAAQGGLVGHGSVGTAKAAESLPIWARAHRDLDSMRETLMKCREDAQQRGRMADREIADIDAALNRIQPPVPEAIGVNSPSVPVDYPRRW